MKNLLLAMLILVATASMGQSTNNEIYRKGFVIGAAIGGGSISIATGSNENLLDKSETNLSLPNLKLGWMLNQKMAVMLQVPGMLYEYEGKDRGFEALVPSLQFWPTNKWWVNGGAGLAMDLPAFYEVSNVADEEWNFGCAVVLGTGYEIFQRNNFALDIQSRLQLGRVNLENETHRDGVLLMVGLGFNWY